MLTLEQMAEMLKDRNIKAVSEATGISRPTLYSIKNGEDGNFRHTTLFTLSKYLERK